MAINEEDITLNKFLEKFRFESSPPDPQKLTLSNADFINTASILKLCTIIERRFNKL